MTKSISFVLGCLLAFSWFYALDASPVPVMSVKNDPTGVILQMQPGVLQLQVSGDRTVHVLYAADGNLPKTPTGFAVQQQPPPGKFEVIDTADAVSLKTAHFEVHVNKKTGSLSFRDASGNSFLEETANGGKSITPSTVARRQTNTVEQEFVRDPAEGLYGLGQHPTGQMNYDGAIVHLQQKNSDIAIPVLTSSRGYGVFWNNASITDVIFGKSSEAAPTVKWKSESGHAIDYYVFYGPDIDRVIADYRDLTGAAPMFGRWAWGFWQSKQRYYSQKQLLEVAAHYRQMHVPIDGIVQDWLYWYPAPWGSHQFDPERYPDPSAMMKQLHEENIRLLISVWAKFDVGSDNSKELTAAGGLCSPVIPYAYPPGKGQWYDPYNPKARSIYWNQIAREIFSKGVDGWWLDASEAEISGKWGEFRSFETAAGPGTDVFNAYPLMHTSSVYEGQRAETPDKRVFILTRSAYAGQQRNAAVSWSGDIKGTWDVFARQVPEGINFTMSGIPYWNTDTGGFFSPLPGDPKYDELFTRWYQFSAFCPMFRVHGSATEGWDGTPKKDHPGKEIWAFPPDTQKILIDYDKLRYHLLPYIYSVAWNVTSAGSTMMRGLAMDFPQDPKVLNIPDQYMFGPALMVDPVTAPAGAAAQMRNVYLPEGVKWIDFWTGESLHGGQSVVAPAPIEKMPLYVRAGSIIPYGPEVQSAMEKEDPIELRVYRGASGSFTLYEDENDNYNYEKGVHATIPFTWDDGKQTLTIGERQGQFPGMLQSRTFRVVLVSPNHGSGIGTTEKPDKEVIYTGAALTVSAR